MIQTPPYPYATSATGLADTGCVSHDPGHVPSDAAVRRAVHDRGRAYRVTRLDGQHVHVVDDDGTTARWWVHDTTILEVHLSTTGPTVHLFDGGALLVGARWTSAAVDGVATPCVEGPVRPHEVRYAWLEVTLASDDLEGRYPYVAARYRLDPPLRQPYATYPRVVVLGRATPRWSETLVLEARPDGRVNPMCDLPGSYDGGTDHTHALNRLGYEVVLPPLGS